MNKLPREVLIKAGAKLNIRDAFGKETAPGIARKGGFTGIVKLLQSLGAVE